MFKKNVEIIIEDEISESKEESLNNNSNQNIIQEEGDTVVE